MLQQWQEMVYLCWSSGQTAEPGCREHGIPVATFCRRLAGRGTEKEKSSAKITHTQALQPVRNDLPATTFEAIPYSDLWAADNISNAQILLQNGEWKLGIRNETDILLQILEVLR